MAVASRREGGAFAPAHVTGVFAPRLEEKDPRARGSVGAGLVLGPGARAVARFRPGSRRAVRLSSNVAGRLPISTEVARRLIAGRSGTLAVRLVQEMPVGCGFGTSAGGALATGLAVGSVLRAPRRRAVEVAHLADLFGRGGLGGVAAILGGGLELRLRPGIPPFGRVVHRRVTATVLVGTLGRPLRSPEVLSDRRRLERFRVGEELLDELAADPTLSTFWDVAEVFTERAGLASRGLGTVLRGLRRRGARAFQAMFGETFVAGLPDGASGRAVLRWLSTRSIPSRAVPISAHGAREEPQGTTGARGPSASP